MSRAETPRPRVSVPANEPEEAQVDEELDQATDEPPDDLGEDELADELAEETGLDLTDASDLDADNVPADEEFDRVMQAPD